MNLEDLSTRLDKQAAAIRDLRRRVKELEQGASPSTEPAQAQPGIFVPSPDCIYCSQPKEASRIALSCRACGKRRQAVINGEEPDREWLLFTECVNCHAPRSGPNSNPLCNPCSTAFRKWKASN